MAGQVPVLPDSEQLIHDGRTAAYCFRYPFFRNHSIKIFSTKEETVRKSSAAAFSSAALVSGWTLTPSEGVFPMTYFFLR